MSASSARVPKCGASIPRRTNAFLIHVICLGMRCAYISPLGISESLAMEIPTPPSDHIPLPAVLFVVHVVTAPIAKAARRFAGANADLSTGGQATDCDHAHHHHDRDRRQAGSNGKATAEALQRAPAAGLPDSGQVRSSHPARRAAACRATGSSSTETSRRLDCTRFR